MKPNEIKSLMVLRKVTGAQIARQEGVTKTWVSQVVNCKKRSRRIQKAIADAVGEDYQKLWNENSRR